MAIMIPPDIEDFTTEGEGIFYKFLENVCKPDEDFIIWYTPDIKDREPDFMLFRRDFGLIIFEIKDWSLDQIEETDDKRFIIIKNNKKETCSNPLHQAKGYNKARTARLLGVGRATLYRFLDDHPYLESGK